MRLSRYFLLMVLSIAFGLFAFAGAASRGQTPCGGAVWCGARVGHGASQAGRMGLQGSEPGQAKDRRGVQF